MSKQSFIRFAKKNGYAVYKGYEGEIWFWRGKYLFSFESWWSFHQGWMLRIFALDKDWEPEYSTTQTGAMMRPRYWKPFNTKDERGWTKPKKADAEIQFNDVYAKEAYKLAKEYLKVTNIRALIVASKL